ncbi:AAA family ATPase [Desulfobacula phenolica]|uniref:Endopeptidase Clp ATP-binding regulatory subunit (ClpX) n=1 Tax=Desulfobacula phenolica TaxID=90732 RepID=A0A1H2EWM8_9BACT|nr:AAA family ATPase [Desulfobacula phenolica]SDT99108.1 endopeptidase Clp ATP-binding regulatory subunit (clpX) [Desulfobacula phenolica]
MTNKKDIRSQDPKKIEKELGEFLNKKFGGNVKIISPSVLTQQEPISGKPADNRKKNLINFNIKPQELITYLDQYVVRQAKAKSVLATKICTHFNRIRHSQTSGEEMSKITGNIKSNILMLGPTGIGKTYLIKLIAKKIGVPFVKADATKFSETGYVGGDVEDLIRDLVKDANDDIALAECGIVYIDEIDKIAASPNVIGAQVSRTGVQRALLKPMEETDVDLKVPHDPVSMMQELEAYQRTGKRSRRRVNTSNILFIVSGAFGGLSDVIRTRLSKQNIGFGSKLVKSQNDHDLLNKTKAEDLVNFGFESEFIGRIPVRCILEPLSEEDLFSILKMPNNPVTLSKRLDFNAYGIKIVFTDDALKFLAQKASKENTGARGLVSAVEEALLDFEEKLPSHNICKFAVTKKVLEDPKNHLNDLISKQNQATWDKLYEKAFLDHKTYISNYIKDNWKTFSVGHGLTLSESLCNMMAFCFCNTVMEIEDAVKKIKKLHDSVKEIELEVSKSYNLNIVFEEDAIDFLIEQFIKHNATSEEILTKIYDNYYDGFNLIREKTGKNRFFLSKKALVDHETYLNDIIRKEII